MAIKNRLQSGYNAFRAKNGIVGRKSGSKEPMDEFLVEKLVYKLSQIKLDIIHLI